MVSIPALVLGLIGIVTIGVLAAVRWVVNAARKSRRP